MIITADTTVEQIDATPANRRAALVQAVTAPYDSRGYRSGAELATLAQQIEAAEAVASVQHVVRMILQDGGDVMEYLVQTLTQNPDDTWSGRGNETRRVANDAVREYIRDQVRVLSVRRVKA